VYGYVYTDVKIRINFECINKKGCLYWITNKDDFIDTGSYDDLDLMISRFACGYYDRKITCMKK
jgi:hypothetical protein